MKPITVKTRIAASPDKVWEYWTNPDHITNWNFATPEWQCPSAINELKPGGTFSWRMEAKDGSMGFDYQGTYDTITVPSLIEKKLDDGRRVTIKITGQGDDSELSETFEPDANHPDLQRQGWQAILDNFKQYVEAN